MWVYFNEINRFRKVHTSPTHKLWHINYGCLLLLFWNFRKHVHKRILRVWCFDWLLISGCCHQFSSPRLLQRLKYGCLASNHSWSIWNWRITWAFFSLFILVKYAYIFGSYSNFVSPTLLCALDSLKNGGY